MKKIVLLLPILAVMGAAGFFAEPYLFRPPEILTEQAAAPEAETKEVLFKMPLGKFTMQVVGNRRTLHLLFDIDVYLAGAANFERLNGAMGRAQLRDVTVREVAELAETALWVNDENIANLDPRLLAEEIVRRLYRTFPSVRTAKVNQFAANVSVKN
ncbi:MAG: flagellar biosynthesis protein FlgH [Brevirhabdus sp.]